MSKQKHIVRQRTIIQQVLIIKVNLVEGSKPLKLSQNKLLVLKTKGQFQRILMENSQKVTNLLQVTCLRL
jgi:hypothetical protein